MNPNEHDHDHMGHHMMGGMGVNTTTPTMMAHPTGGHENHHAHSGHGAHGTHDASGGHHQMKMFFHCSAEATVLFDGWTTTSWQTMLASCVAIFIMAALYEGLKVGREFLLRRSTRHMTYNAVPVSNVNGNVEIKQPEGRTSQGLRMLSCAHALQTMLHLVQIVLSYFLMLIFMTYNVWLCMAVALGATAGYFLFSWKRPIVTDINEHCH